MTVLMISGALMVVTALAHSILGERRLLRPMFEAPSGVLQRTSARHLLRMAWHFTSVLMVMTAFVVAWPGTAGAVRIVIGAGYLVAGLGDALVTRGRHVGWPLLAAAGAAALLGSG